MNKYECYCCHKELEEKDGTWISATMSEKRNDGTNAEKRLVCNNCNHIKENK